MERGALFVLGAVLLVGAFALSAMLAGPTGMVPQDGSVYPTDSAFLCRNYQEALYLGNNAQYHFYCCPEDMSGQNDCRATYQILKR